MNDSTPEQRARRRAEEYISLLWHIATYVIVVPFLFFIDWRDNQYIDWAYWAAIPWGVALVFHAASYFMGSSFRDRAYERFLEQEKRKDAQS